MAYVITSLCVDCKDTACADVCPVECIYEQTSGDKGQYANQLYINPDECIDCTNCEPACPWKAIYEEDEVPSLFKGDIASNAAIVEDIKHFTPAKVKKGTPPTKDQVVANYDKWSFRP